MSAITLPRHSGPAGRAGRAGGATRSLALGLALLLIAGAVALLAFQVRFRAAEAVVAARLMDPFVAGTTAPAGPIVWFGLGTDGVTGFMITPLCSTVILVTPLMALAGVMLLVRPLSTGRTLVGLAIGAAIVAACNLFRYCFAAFALQRWGEPGFEAVHRYAGSLLVIAGFITAFILLLRLATATPSAARRLQNRGRHS